MTLRRTFAAMVLSAALLAPLPTVGAVGAESLNTAAGYRAGTVLRYDFGIMEQVIRNRQNPRHRGYVKGFKVRRDVAGYVALRSCRTIGKVVYIRVGSGPIRRYQQVDCQHYRDRHNLRHVVAELDGRSAAREGFYRRGKTTAVCWGC